MGFALPAAVGAAFATNRPIVTAIGDGSVMMNLQELQVIRHHNLNVKVIITNNDAYAVIRKRQRDLFRGRTIGTDQTNGISCPDYSQIAIGFGLKYVRITELSELEQVLANELSTVDPAIIEVMTDTEQDYVRTSRATLQSRKSVVRPIEDQYPFLERDIVRREMVIEPFNLE
jgi:acetolactate synthase-1/2/3 large subunit